MTLRQVLENLTPNECLVFFTAAAKGFQSTTLPPISGCLSPPSVATITPLSIGIWFAPTCPNLTELQSKKR